MQGPVSFIETQLHNAFAKIAHRDIAHDFAQQLIEESNDTLVITQDDDQMYFIMDESQTYGTPSYPTLGQTETFTLGGIWIQEVNLDRINFQCRIFGALAYNENTYFQQDMEVGFWTTDIPFDVPPVAPSTTYHVTVTAYSGADEELFVMTTEFNF